MAADYDLNAIADALRDLFQGEVMYVVGGVNVPLNAFSEVQGQVQAPALVIDLDDVDWDLTFQRGADAFTFRVSVLLQSADSTNGQRILRAALSTGGIGTRIKDVMETDKTLGGLVSYADMVGTRKVGVIQYGGVEYVGAELIIEVVAQ